MKYEAPKVTDLGTVRDLTLQDFNKIGRRVDQINPTGALGVVGSIVPIR